MSAKQTMICSFSVSMLAPQEKHSWHFCSLSSLPCTRRRSGLTLYSIYRRENECNQKLALSKYLEFRKSCFQFYKAWSQNAAADSLRHTLPPVCILASTRSGAGSPLVHNCKHCQGRSHFNSALPQAPQRLWQKGISSTKRGKRVNWQHVLVPRKYEKELEKAQEWRFTFKHIWKICNHSAPEVRQTRSVLGTTV